MEDMIEVAAVPSSLVPCSICRRTFRPDALERHITICQKTAAKAKKMKVFDSSKQRAEGTEITQVRPPPNAKKAQAKEKVEPPKPKSNWRQQHQEFISAIRAAKGTEIKEEDGETNTPVSNNQTRVPAGYIPCPSCGRNFSERAADRHIPWCQDRKNKSDKSGVSKDASERMKLRTKYRAPVPGKKNSPSNSAYSGSGTGHSSARSSIPSPPPPRVNDDDNNNNRGDANNNKVSQFPNKNNAMNEKIKAAKDFKRPKPPVRKNLTNANRVNINDANIKKVIVVGKENQSRTSHPIMKFKEKFPNSNYKSFAMDENYEGYMLRSNNAFSRTPRTVPGVRTGGQATLNANHEKSNLWRNHRQENEGDDLNLLQTRFEDLGSNFRSMNGEADLSWAKKLNNWDTSNAGLPQIGSSEALIQHAPHGSSETRVSTGSSSGDDGSLPPISRGSSTDGNRVPRFCHQCGTKYPVNGAKYCCECGARRLASANGMAGQVI